MEENAENTCSTSNNFNGFSNKIIIDKLCTALACCLLCKLEDTWDSLGYINKI